MKKEDLSKLIELEKEELRKFLNAIKRFALNPVDVEDQINFYLEKIKKLIDELKKTNYD